MQAERAELQVERGDRAAAAGLLRAVSADPAAPTDLRQRCERRLRELGG